MWESLRTLEPDHPDESLEEDSQLAIWTEVFKIYWILQRQVIPHNESLLFISHIGVELKYIVPQGGD